MMGRPVDATVFVANALPADWSDVFLGALDVGILAVPAGREWTRQAVQAALQAQAQRAEKKGRPAGSAPAAARRLGRRGTPRGMS